MANTLRALLIASLLCLVVPCLRADSVVDQSFTTFSGTGTLSAYINEADAYVAQTFTAGVTGILTGVSIDILSDTVSGSPAISPFPMNVSIYTVVDGVPTSNILGATVGPGSIPLSYLISFSAPMAIESGTQYAIAVNYIGAPPIGPGAGQGFWVGATGNPYSGGAAFASVDGNKWFEEDSSPGVPVGDLFFQTYVTPAAVLEPSSLTLITVGMFALLLLEAVGYTRSTKEATLD